MLKFVRQCALNFANLEETVDDKELLPSHVPVYGILMKTTCGTHHHLKSYTNVILCKKNKIYRMNKIDELAICRLQQTHKLQSLKPKDRTFQMGVKILSLGISVTCKH